SSGASLSNDRVVTSGECAWASASGARAEGEGPPPERWRFVSPSGGGPSPSALAPEAEAHAHSPDVTTLSFESEAPLDLHKLKVWLQFVASRRDAELIRMKGILNCSGHATAVVAQAVYQWLEIGPSELERPATSRLVLIGRDLDRDALARGWALLR
ncbi:MAG: GTP-binding protein, partial [Planctomycetota bacterium]